MRIGGKGVRDFLWRLAKATAWVAGGITFLTFIPEEAAPWLIFMMIVTVLPVIIVIGAVAFFAIRRPQAFGFTVLAILILTGIQAGVMAIQAARVESLELRTFLPASEEHSVLIADHGASACDSLCMEVLAESRIRMFVQRHGSSDKSTALELRSGQTCLDPGSRESYLTFLQAGFLDMCASEVSLPAGYSALTIKAFHGRRARRGHEGVPGTFEGSIYELHETRDGQDRLLGRWVEGHIRPASYWFGAVGLGRWPVGGPFEKHEFIAAALQAPLVGGQYPGGANLDDVFDRLEALPPDPALELDVREAYRTLAGIAGIDGRDLLVGRAGRLLGSKRPDQILNGFTLLQPLWNTDLHVIAPRVTALLDHDDPQVAFAALDAIYKLPQEDRQELRTKLVALAEGPVLATPDPSSLRSLLGHYRQIGVFTSAEQEHAKALLAGNDALAGPQRVALLSIVAHGGSEMREQASRVLLALNDQAFVDLVIAMNALSWRDVSGVKLDGWTERERTELIERAKRVPLERLKQYVEILQSQGAVKERAADIAAVIETRITEAKSIVPPDQKRIDELERLLRRFQKAASAT